METQSNEIKWTSVVWAALLMVVIPIVILILIQAIYPTYVGFATRGDPEQINAAIQAVGTSIVFQVIVYAVFAAVALWRAYVLVKKVPAQILLHVGSAVVIAAVLVFAWYFAGSGGAFASIWDDVLIIAIMLAGGAYLGTLLKPSQAAQA